jgi:hypothetical protein
MLGANSLLETGNMRFGCELYLHPIASFPFPGNRGHFFYGHFFRLVFSYSLIFDLTKARPGSTRARSFAPPEKRLRSG